MTSRKTDASFGQQKEAIVEYLRKEGETRERDELISLLDGPEIMQHPNLGQLFQFKGALGTFWVSQREQVVMHSAPPRLSARAAQDYVQEFLKRHVNEYEMRNFEQTDAGLTDPLWKEAWRERPQERHGQVSIFENWADVHVNLETHRVHYFNRSDLRHVRTSAPGIDEEAARKLIQQRKRGAEIVELRLTEHTSDGGTTWRTIWHAALLPAGDPENPRDIYSIDADTGEHVP